MRPYFSYPFAEAAVRLKCSEVSLWGWLDAMRWRMGLIGLARWPYADIAKCQRALDAVRAFPAAERFLVEERVRHLKDKHYYTRQHAPRASIEPILEKMTARGVAWRAPPTPCPVSASAPVVGPRVTTDTPRAYMARYLAHSGIRAIPPSRRGWPMSAAAGAGIGCSTDVPAPTCGMPGGGDGPPTRPPVAEGGGGDMVGRQKVYRRPRVIVYAVFPFGGCTAGGEDAEIHLSLFSYARHRRTRKVVRVPYRLPDEVQHPEQCVVVYFGENRATVTQLKRSIDFNSTHLKNYMHGSWDNCASGEYVLAVKTPTNVRRGPVDVIVNFLTIPFSGIVPNGFRVVPGCVLPTSLVPAPPCDEPSDVVVDAPPPFAGLLVEAVSGDSPAATGWASAEEFERENVRDLPRRWPASTVPTSPLFRKDRMPVEVFEFIHAPQSGMGGPHQLGSGTVITMRPTCYTLTMPCPHRADVPAESISATFFTHRVAVMNSMGRLESVLAVLASVPRPEPVRLAITFAVRRLLVEYRPVMLPYDAVYRVVAVLTGKSRETHAMVDLWRATFHVMMPPKGRRPARCVVLPDGYQCVTERLN